MTIANVKDGGILTSGFLEGTLTYEAALRAIEVSVDGGAFGDATSTSLTRWTYQVPHPASGTVWPLGSTHTLRTRATDILGNVTTSAAITITRGPNWDVNGDGYNDLVLGDPGYYVYVFHSKGAAGVAGDAVSDADTVIADPLANKNFGVSLALGDVNGDGYADVVAGADSAVIGEETSGLVYVYHSEGPSGIDHKTQQYADATLTGTSGFGASVAVGDVNADGFADVFAGNPNESAVHVYYSEGEEGVGPLIGDSVTLTGDTAFGRSIALGDTNGDGKVDVAVGTGSTGNRVYVFHGAGPAGISDTTADTVLTGPVSGLLGHSVALGDVDGDGYDDLAAGAPGANSNAGAAYVFYSSGSGGIASGDHTSAGTALLGNSGFSLGLSVAIGDVNGDGHGDVAAGAPGASSNAGAVYLFHSPADGEPIPADSHADADATLSGSAASDGLGAFVSLGDLNGDGYADVLTPAVNIEPGGVSYLFLSQGTAGVAAAGAAAADITYTGASRMAP